MKIRKKRKKHTPLWAVCVLDLLLVGIVLLSFAFFHHVRPAMIAEQQRAEAQAKEFGHSLRREVGYLTIHSMLHLLGYDHLDEGPMKAQMREREEAIAATIPGMTRN